MSGNTVPAVDAQPAIETAAAPERQEHTMLRDTFMRVRRFGKLMSGEGFHVWIVCPQCQEAVAIVLEAGGHTGLQCKCSHWSVR